MYSDAKLEQWLQLLMLKKTTQFNKLTCIVDPFTENISECIRIYGERADCELASTDEEN